MKGQSRVQEIRGVEPPDVGEMVVDFEDQARLKPRLLQNGELKYEKDEREHPRALLRDVRTVERDPYQEICRW